MAVRSRRRIQGLPEPSFRNGRIRVAGLGTLSLVGVSNADHATGIRVHAHLEDSATAEPGNVHFRLALDPDLNPKWDVNPSELARLHRSRSPLARIVDAGRTVLADLHERDPDGMAADLRGAIMREFLVLTSRRRGPQRIIARYEQVEASARSADDEDEARQMIDAETERLERFESESGGRLTALAGALTRLDAWLAEPPAERGDLLAVLRPDATRPSARPG